jgi:UDP-N-acetylmuramate dehydrogenase
MNAGAYGGEMKDVILSTRACNPKTGEFTVTGEEHGFSYRHSRFSDTDDVVLSSVIRLRKSNKENIKSKMDELSARRRESQPLDLPSAGSTFKRPQKEYAAALIEQAGLKGFAIGGAAVSEKHSGFIVNRGDAAYADVMAVIDHVRERVLEQFGIELELEVKILKQKK